MQTQASIDNQIEKSKNYCLYKGYEVKEVIIDKARSAGNLNREGIQRVIEMVKRKEVDCVVVNKLDRISRSVSDLCELLKLFELKSVGFVSVADSIEFQKDNPMSKFTINLFASIAELEKGMIGLRTKEAIEYRRSQHQRFSRHTPFGYDLADNGDLSENETEQVIIQFMIQARDNGLSYQKICDALEKEGYKSKLGGPWRKAVVRKIILQNLKANEAA